MYEEAGDAPLRSASKAGGLSAALLQRLLTPLRSVTRLLILVCVLSPPTRRR